MHNRGVYVPAHFAMTPAETAQALADLRAADLVTWSPDGLVATFLPLLYDADRHALLGHVARNNPHWRVAAGATESLVIAHDADHYISPAWYATKQEHGRVVPTWNYTTLHVYGPLTVHDDVTWLRTLVTRLTDRHEDGRAEAWHVTDAPERYVDGQLRAIVGMEMTISRVEAKAKLSQNRSALDRAGVVRGLAGEPGDAARVLAAQMEAAQMAAAQMAALDLCSADVGEGRLHDLRAQAEAGHGRQPADREVANDAEQVGTVDR
jgi:transcriptional regulator